MPPPGFSSNVIGSMAVNGIPPVPKHVNNLVKDLSTKIRAVLVSPKALPLQPVLTAIEGLHEDPAWKESYPGSQSSSVGDLFRDGKDGAAKKDEAKDKDGDKKGGAQTLPSGPTQQQIASSWRTSIARRFNSELTDVFADDVDQEDLSRLCTLVEIIYHLDSFISTNALVTDWWELLLRPMLKNAHIPARTAALARQLVVKAMSSAPDSAYPDEPAPQAVWPAVDEPGTAARKAGDAPYTLAAAAVPSSPTRSKRSNSSASSSASAILPASPKITKAAKPDMFKRFAQRIFDLYTSEIIHGEASIDEENQHKDAAEEAQEELGDETAVAPNAGENGMSSISGSQSAAAATASTEAKAQAAEVWRSNLESILLAFGSSQAKRFFHHVADSFSDGSARICLLVLLTTFLRLHSMHTYYISSTPLPKQLLLSLQLDTSSTVISLGMTALVMLMPHIPDWIANGGAGGLPTFLSILARIIDWRKLGRGWEERAGEEHEAERRAMDEEFTEVDRLARRLNIRPELEWQRVDTSADKVEVPAPDPTQYFTFVYGLFPCNTIRFLRAPIDYLRKASYESPFEGDWEDMIDEIAIQTRSGNVLRRHALHPSLIQLNAEKEVRDKQRWLKHEAADITAQCMSLYLGAWHDQGLQDFAFTPRRDSLALAPSPLVSGTALLASVPAFDDRDLDHSLSMAGSLAESEEVRGRAFGLSQLEAESEPSSSFGANMAAGLAQAPILEHRRGSSAGVSMASGSPMIRPADSVTARTAVNADDILSTYAALKRGEPVVTPQRQRLLDYRSAPSSATRPLNRGSLWSGEPSLDHPFNPHAGPSRSSSTSRWGALSGIPSPAPTPGIAARFKFPGAPNTGPQNGLTTDAPTSMPPSPIIPDSVAAAGGETGTTTSVPPSPKSSHAPEFLRGRVSRGQSPTRTSLEQRSAHQHPLTVSYSAATRSTDSSNRPARAEVYAQLMSLQRENLLLRNELNFELYLKEQHLRHIGRLHRERVGDTALEAERHNLYFSVKSLRAQLAVVTNNAEKQRAEAATIKARHLTWENEQNSRLKSFREERRNWVAEMQSVKAQLEEANGMIKAQELQMEEALSARFEAEARLTIAEPKLKNIAEYEAKVQQLSNALSHWEADVHKYEEQRREMELLLNRWSEMEIMLETLDAQAREAERREEEAQNEIEDLKRKLSTRERRETPPAKDAETVVGQAAVSEKPDEPKTENSDLKQAEFYRQRTSDLEKECLELKARLGEALAAAEFARGRALSTEEAAEAADSAADDSKDDDDVTELQLP